MKLIKCNKNLSFILEFLKKKQKYRAIFTSYNGKTREFGRLTFSDIAEFKFTAMEFVFIRLFFGTQINFMIE